LDVAETGTETVPASCLQFGITSCGQLDQDTMDNGLIVKSTCTGDVTKSCSCSVSVSGTIGTTGTYITTGNDFIATPGGGTPSGPTPYCASGFQLEIAGGLMGNSTSNTYILLTK